MPPGGNDDRDDLLVHERGVGNFRADACGIRDFRADGCGVRDLLADERAACPLGGTMTAATFL